MSGRLVGEVMDNARRLQDAGLSHRGLVALLVIAEGCRDESRQGRVARSRVADVLGATDRTATRAVQELVAADLVTVVESARRRASAIDPATGSTVTRGYATLYRVAALGSWGDIQVSPETAVLEDTQVSPQIESWEDTQVSPQIRSGETNPKIWGDKSEHLGGHPGVSLPVRSPVGESRGARAGTRVRVRAREGEPPPRYCPKHPEGTLERCGGCAEARRERDAWVAVRVRAERQAASDAAQARAADRARAIAACVLCDADGYRSGRPCDHNPQQDEINARGSARARAELDAALSGRTNR